MIASQRRGHLLPREGRGWEWSEQRESKPVTGTYNLERAEFDTSQKTERKKASKGHLLPEKGRGWD